MSSINKRYYEARGYAFTFSPSLSTDGAYTYIDLVHDAYLSWYKKTGRNLFEEHRGVISQVVKNTWKGKLVFNKFTWKGEKYNKQYLELRSDTYTDEETKGYVPVTTTSPDLILEAKEIEVNLRKKITPRHNRFLDKLIEGYTTTEISNIEGISRIGIAQARRNFKAKLDN